MDILNQSVGYNDTGAGTVVLVRGTVIPTNLEDVNFLDFLEDNLLLERAPRGFEPNEKQSFFLNKETPVVEIDDHSIEDDTEEVEDEAIEDEVIEDETVEDDADPDLFAVGAAALAEATIDDIEEMLKSMDEAQAKDLLALETTGEGRKRKGVKEAVARRLKTLRGG